MYVLYDRINLIELGLLYKQIGQRVFIKILGSTILKSAIKEC